MGSYNLQKSMYFVLFASIFLNVQGKNILTYDYSDFKELKCEYNLVTGDQMCDCKNRNKKYILPVFHGTVKNVIVQNCELLYTNHDTFQDVDYIDHIRFTNIKELIFESYSLEFKKRLSSPKIKLIFNDVYFSEIVPYSISGYIDSIAFNNCRIGKLNAYAVNSVYQTVYSISFENTIIDFIESQALKKLSIEHLTLRNLIFSSDLPSRMFSALTITNDITISNCSFATINSHAIELDDVNDFIFSENKIVRFDSEAFRINANGRIIFERNNFSQFSHSALSAISVEQSVKQHQMEIQFLSNQIYEIEHPIRMDVKADFIFRILDLKFSRKINCDIADNQLKKNIFLKQYTETVYFRFDDSDDGYKSLSTILSNQCATQTYLIAVISTVIVLILILVIIVVTFFYRFWMKRQPKRQLHMIVPDGKTYKETQIMIQIENAGLLKTNL